MNDAYQRVKTAIKNANEEQNIDRIKEWYKKRKQQKQRNQEMKRKQSERKRQLEKTLKYQREKIVEAITNERRKNSPFKYNYRNRRDSNRIRK